MTTAHSFGPVGRNVMRFYEERKRRNAQELADETGCSVEEAYARLTLIGMDLMPADDAAFGPLADVPSKAAFGPLAGEGP